jgi:phenylacetate-coenzyme A ligase PaaK-like adenylate-forming protein
LVYWQFSEEYRHKSLEILEKSLNQVPAYKSWKAFDPGPAYSTDARFAAMPALTKPDIRAHFPEGFVPEGQDIKQALESGIVQAVSTSGSSDFAVTNIWNQEWWNASEQASWKLNSIAGKLATGDHPEAIMANPRNVGIISDDNELPMEKRRISRFLFLNEKTNPVAWTPEHMDRMIDELAIFKPAVLEANPSLLARFARYAAGSNRKVFQPGLIVYTYEYPTQLHYKQIRRVFKCPMASSYGSTETGYVFMQCEKGKLHQNTEFCRVDFEPLKKEHGGPNIGRILVTTFNNPWYYMLRFDVKDLARVDEEGKCACGRNSGMILEAIEGRNISLTLTTEGRLVTLREADNAISSLDGIDEYGLEQVSKKEYRLRLVSGRTDKNRLTEESTRLLKNLYGREAEITVNFEDALFPESSGKYSYAKALFPINLDDYLDKKQMRGWK